jgi:CubicO group peptidase (beta-lactamase class C family)
MTVRAALAGMVLTVAGCAAPQDKTVSVAPASAEIRPAKVKIAFTRTSIKTEFVEGDAGVAGRPVTINDPVRVASISKLVVALGAMRLVDEGKLDLDRDVSAYLGWRIRNPAFPDAPITMRQLLSHRAGLTDGIDYIMPLDGDLSTILANPKAWDDAHPPGSYFRYANINSPLIAATMEAATGERFDRLMERLVLVPLKLDACYNWSAGCSAGRRAQAVTLLRPNGNLAKDAAITGTDPCPVQTASDGSCDIDKSYRLGRNGSAFSPQGGYRRAIWRRSARSCWPTASRCCRARPLPRCWGRSGPLMAAMATMKKAILKRTALACTGSMIDKTRMAAGNGSAMSAKLIPCALVSG